MSHRAERPHRFLLVDDDPLMYRSVRRMIRRAHPDWEIAIAETGEQALAELDRRSYDVLVTDLNMPSLDGLALLGIVAKRHFGLVCVVHSAQIETEDLDRIKHHAHAIVVKGVSADELRRTLEWALETAIASRRDSQSGAC